MLLMVRPWSVSFSGLLLWFLSLQLGLFDINRSQAWDLNTKNIISCLNLVGNPCALAYKKFRITCFLKVQHFVETRPCLWLIKRPVFASHWVAKVWQRTRWFSNSWRFSFDAMRMKCTSATAHHVQLEDSCLELHTADISLVGRFFPTFELLVM